MTTKTPEALRKEARLLEKEAARIEKEAAEKEGRAYAKKIVENIDFLLSITPEHYAMNLSIKCSESKHMGASRYHRGETHCLRCEFLDAKVRGYWPFDAILSFRIFQRAHAHDTTYHVPLHQQFKKKE